MSTYKRLTTENPHGNMENMLNITKIINREVYLRDWNGEGDLNLVDFCKTHYKEMYGTDLDVDCGVKVGSEDFGDHMDDDSLLSTFYWMSVGYAELRQRLSTYEDTGLAPDEIKNIVIERTALLEELDNARPCFACAGFTRNGGKCFGANSCGMADIMTYYKQKAEYERYAAKTKGESWRWRGPVENADKD